MKYFNTYNDFIGESILLDYLKNIASMNLGEKQKEFFKWKLSNAKIIKTKSSTSNKKLSSIVSSFLTTNKIEKKMCFEVASKLTMYTNIGIEYVEGEINVSNIPVEHAWNKYKNIYFDLINEIVWEGNLKAKEYMKIIEIGSKDVMKYLNKTKVYGSLLAEFYKDKIEK